MQELGHRGFGGQPKLSLLAKNLSDRVLALEDNDSIAREGEREPLLLSLTSIHDDGALLLVEDVILLLAGSQQRELHGDLALYDGEVGLVD